MMIASTKSSAAASTSQWPSATRERPAGNPAVSKAIGGSMPARPEPASATRASRDPSGAPGSYSRP